MSLQGYCCSCVNVNNAWENLSSNTLEGSSDLRFKTQACKTQSAHLDKAYPDRESAQQGIVLEGVDVFDRQASCLEQEFFPNGISFLQSSSYQGRN